MLKRTKLVLKLKETNFTFKIIVIVCNHSGCILEKQI